ncbi:hypothetical protein [Clostridium psychrophilum]|nr:hypothetical protein [Clostridium psychrophilum]MBU3181660.1 hypothetical protein [Clostridium psychrophilum]
MYSVSNSGSSFLVNVEYFVIRIYGEKIRDLEVKTQVANNYDLAERI